MREINWHHEINMQYTSHSIVQYSTVCWAKNNEYFSTCGIFLSARFVSWCNFDFHHIHIPISPQCNIRIHITWCASDIVITLHMVWHCNKSNCASYAYHIISYYAIMLHHFPSFLTIPLYHIISYDSYYQAWPTTISIDV